MQGLKTLGFLCAAFACVAHAAVVDDEPSVPAQYEFSYAVNDPTTGDQKDQQETRIGNDVTGYYRTVDSDGFLRTVRYKADAVNGFTAEVVREPVSGAAAVPIVAKAAVPIVAKTAAVIKPVVVPAAVPSVVPYVAAPSPASYYFGGASAGYPYNYQPYSYGYQRYPYGYQQYPYGYQQYPYGYQQYPYAYSPYSYGQYDSPAVRK